MARTPNDDRSDSMNPNNSAYDASESNRLNQIGAYDDDDDDLQVSSSGSSFSYCSQPIEPAIGTQVMELEVIVPSPPVRVHGLNLLVISNNGKAKAIKVDAGSIEEAVDDTTTIFHEEQVAYVALYDKRNIYVELTRSKQFAPDALKSLPELHQLEELIAFAAKRFSSARSTLNSAAESSSGRQALGRFLESYGSCYSALQGLRAERSERIEELRAKGSNVTEETAPELEREAKLSEIVTAKAQWVRDFQSGKVRLDAIGDVFTRTERILDVKEAFNRN
jgi:hypothetical protein